MRKFLIYLLVLFFPLLTHAEIPFSQERYPNEPWQNAIQREAARWGVKVTRRESIEANALPNWPGSLDELAALFAQARETRWYKNPNRGSYKRRAPWLYPHDGCYAKAAHVSAIAKAQGLIQPGKIFAYGDLRYFSPYNKNGRVIWWSFHVAAAYNVGGTVYVLDPGVNDGVTTIAGWLGKIAKDPASVQLDFCDSHAYSPYSECQGGRGNGAYLGHIPGLLDLEWKNLAAHGYPVDELLGP